MLNGSQARGQAALRPGPTARPRRRRPARVAPRLLRFRIGRKSCAGCWKGIGTNRPSRRRRQLLRLCRRFHPSGPRPPCRQRQGAPLFPPLDPWRSRGRGPRDWRSLSRLIGMPSDCKWRRRNGCVRLKPRQPATERCGAEWNTRLEAVTSLPRELYFRNRN
jgi:hypothetical protein